MKDQYVGDINDFEKYSVVNALRDAVGLPLVVGWMLTAADQSGEGSRVDYLTRPDRYRHLEPNVFDALHRIVQSGTRSVGRVEAEGVLGSARFVQRRLTDDLGSRAAFLTELWDSAPSASLIFLDPDIGIAGDRVRRGGRRSSMYVFADELEEGFNRGHSLVVYQHFPRESRIVYLARALTRMQTLCASSKPFAIWSSRVAFLVIPQAHVASEFTNTAQLLTSRWAPLLAFYSRTSDPSIVEI